MMVKRYTLPLVSVIIPAFNATKTIVATIRSVQLQTYPNLELIVVDDGSQDATAAVVAQFENEDPRIRLKRQGNSGVAAARNAALAEARGTLIAPLDADDLWHPRKIEMQVKNMHSSSNTQFDYCWSVDIDERSTVLRCNRSYLEGSVYEALILANFIGNSSVPLISRNVLETVGGWDVSLREGNAQGCEDWLLYLKIAERTKFAVTPAYLVGYRQAPDSMSRQVFEMARSYRAVMAQARSKHPEIKKFQWDKSASDFERYIFELSLASNRRSAALWLMLRAIMRDSSSWKNVVAKCREVAGQLVTSLRPVPAGSSASSCYTVHGLPFELVEPNSRCDICEIPAANATRKLQADA